MRRAMLKKSSYGGAISPIASYPLYTNSNEIIGTTSGIDGVDTAITYNGSEATFNGTTSNIEVPDNSLFNFTDGVNDLPFSFEFDVYFNSIHPTDGVWLVNRRDNSTDYCWQIAIHQGSLTLVVFGAYTGSHNLIKSSHTFSPSLNTYINIKATYDGSKTVNGLKLFINNSQVATTNSQTGTYTEINQVNSKVVIGKRGWNTKGYLNGKMKNLKFYNYEKL